MSIDKKYYWLKLKEGFFREKEIKKLRKIAGGDTYTIIYLKMQLISLKKEGRLYFEGLEESFSEEIALEIDEEVENVKITIMYLLKTNLLEELSENEYLLNRAALSIGSESQGAERVRKFRDKNKDIKVLQGNAIVTKSNTEIEKEKEIELELKREIELELKKKLKKEKQKTFSSDSDEYRLSIYLWKFISNNNGEAKEPNMQKWSKGFDLILRLDNRSIEDIKKVIVFSQGNEFWYKNILSPDKLRNHYEKLTLQMKEPKYVKNIKKGSFNDYEQRDYDFDDLEKKLLGWSKDD